MTPKRNRMGSKKVEELILMKDNRKQIEEFKEEHNELLLSVELVTDPFERISVDAMIANLAHEDDQDGDMFEVDVIEPGEDEIIYINCLSDVESEDEESDIEIV